MTLWDDTRLAGRAQPRFIAPKAHDGEVAGPWRPNQLKRVVFQRAMPHVNRKTSMAAASAAKAGQLSAIFGARARTASVTKIVVAAMTRSQSSHVLVDFVLVRPFGLPASFPERAAWTYSESTP